MLARARATEARIQGLTGGNLAPTARIGDRPLYPGLAAVAPLPPSVLVPGAALEIGSLPPGGEITLDSAQLRRTRQRSQRAITIANRVLDRIAQGLTEQQFRPGSIGSAALG